MERERKPADIFLKRTNGGKNFWVHFILCLLNVCGCTAVGTDTRAAVDIVLSPSGIAVKSVSDEDNGIRDANIFIFSDTGFLERSVYVKGDRYGTTLVKDRRYDIYVCANFGRPISVKTREDLEAIRFHLAHPEDFSTGTPMSGCAKNILPSEEIKIPLIRLCSEIILSFDRSLLDEDVKMTVQSLEIGNCPRYCKAFGTSRVEEADGCFPVGFTRDYLECEPLNLCDERGRSGQVSLSMLENLQGLFPGNPDSDAGKILPENHPGREIFSYVEIGIEYESSYSSSSSGVLKYRFYIGDSFSDANVERNCRYHITVTPRGSGISEDSWRVDKTSLITRTAFSMEPEGYLEVEIGDEIHIRCTWSPEWAPFYGGDEELEEDRKRGIYEYVKDEDGKGVRLTITGYGTGMVYMRAGDPVNQSGLLYLHVKENANKEE